MRWATRTAACRTTGPRSAPTGRCRAGSSGSGSTTGSVKLPRTGVNAGPTAATSATSRTTETSAQTASSGRTARRSGTECAEPGHECAAVQRPARGSPGAWRGERSTVVEVDEELLPGLVLDGPRVQLWRAPTDNDGLPLVAQRSAGPLERWLELGLDRLDLELVSSA